MDGRFVQSNNPFSSPMMDEDSLTPRRTQQQQLFNSSHPLHSFPVPFPSTEDDGKPRGQHVLPPRSRPLGPQSPLNGGYPDQRFSFTGSPIAEVAREATNIRIHTVPCRLRASFRHARKGLDLSRRAVSW